MKTETRMFFEARAARKPPALRFPGCQVHVPERTAREALRHRRREGRRFPPCRSHHRSARRRSQPGQRAHRLQLSDAHVARDPRQVRSAEYLGTPPPPPPPDVPALDEAAVGSAGSLRQQLEKHRSERGVRVVPQQEWTCSASASKTTTPSASGAPWTANSRSIRAARSRTESRSRARPRCATLLKDDLPDFSRCLTEKMLTYALGRGLERYDRKTVEDITRKLGSRRATSFQTLIFEIVRSLPFQSRRGESWFKQSRTSETEGDCPNDDHAQSAAKTNVSARDGNRRRAAVPRCDGARAGVRCRPEGAGSHGVRLRAERHRYAQLESRLRGQARTNCRAS